MQGLKETDRGKGRERIVYAVWGNSCKREWKGAGDGASRPSVEKSKSRETITSLISRQGGGGVIKETGEEGPGRPAPREGGVSSPANGFLKKGGQPLQRTPLRIDQGTGEKIDCFAGKSRVAGGGDVQWDTWVGPGRFSKNKKKNH